MYQYCTYTQYILRILVLYTVDLVYMWLSQVEFGNSKQEVVSRYGHFKFNLTHDLPYLQIVNLPIYSLNPLVGTGGSRVSPAHRVSPA